MAVTMEGSAFWRAMKQEMTAALDDIYGLRREEGLSFKVRYSDPSGHSSYRLTFLR